MNFLEITLEPPSLFSGGGICICQSIKTLEKLGHVDYIGPEFDDGLFEGDDVSVIGYLKYSNKLTSRIKSFFDGVLNGYYQSWVSMKEKIEWEKYDVVSVEFSRYPFLINEIHSHNKKVVCRIHNIERDYYHNLNKSKFSIPRSIQEFFYAKAEKKVFEDSDSLLLLSQNDLCRGAELYGSEIIERSYINPICIDNKSVSPICNQDFNGHIKRVLITGSLWYGPNADGVIWFIENVWSFLQSYDFSLVVAGSKPNDKIRNLCSTFTNIKLVSNPQDMSVFFDSSDVYIAPIFSGAGMKVKVAEAMMYGLPILGTDHAFIGYEQTAGNIRCNTSSDYIHNLLSISNMDSNSLFEIRKQQKHSFLEHNSIEASSIRYKNVIDSMRRKDGRI